MMLAPTDLGTIAAIWAHPDDEAYLCAGLLARAVDAGQRVVVVTATAGELGTGDPNWPPHRLAATRRWETAAAMAALGVTDHRWLGYADGCCDREPPAEAAARLATIVREVSADTIITFGSDGLTGHRDHRAVAEWARLAWELDGRRRRLLTAVAETAHTARFADLERELEVYLEPELPHTVPRHRLAIDLRLDGPDLDRKLVALRSHASQTSAVIGHLGIDVYRQWVAAECFVQVQDAQRPTDLPRRDVVPLPTEGADRSAASSPVRQPPPPGR